MKKDLTSGSGLQRNGAFMDLQKFTGFILQIYLTDYNKRKKSILMLYYNTNMAIK